MSSPITLAGLLDLLNKGLPYSTGEEVEIYVKNKEANSLIYQGPSTKVPAYLADLYKAYDVENVTTPSEEAAKKEYMSKVDDEDKVVNITLKEKDFNVTFAKVFNQHKADDMLYVIDRDSHDMTRVRNLFFGKKSELPKMLYDELENELVAIEAPYSDEWTGNKPERYTITMKEDILIKRDKE